MGVQVVREAAAVLGVVGPGSGTEEHWYIRVVISICLESRTSA